MVVMCCWASNAFLRFVSLACMHVGGGKRISEDLGIPFLGSIPIDPKICENSDSGMPFIVNHSNSPSAKAFMEIVKKIEEYLENRRGD